MRHRNPRRIALAALAAATCATAAPASVHAATGTLQVAAVGGGQVTVTPEPVVPNPDCSSPISSDRAGESGIRDCAFTYEVGTRVELRAEGIPADGGPETTLGRWSDPRCAPMSTCTWTIGPERETVAALFTPQRLSVKVTGAGSVTSPSATLTDRDSDPPQPCSTDGNPITCVADVPVGSVVTLDANPAGSATASWLPQASNGLVALCDDAPPPCSVTVDRPRWASVGFGAEPEDPGVPPEITVAFRVRKAGSGSGMVRGSLIACGDQCSTDTSFGKRDTLTASPDRGSRFDHWAGACGAAPSCSLAVGPITALTAVFERADAGTGDQRPSPAPRLDARVQRLNVRGHGRKRTILIRLQVSVASTVRASLLRGRRQVAAKRFSVAAGSQLLRFRIPARVRPGRYRLRLAVAGAGQSRQLVRRVRLGR